MKQKFTISTFILILLVQVNNILSQVLETEESNPVVPGRVEIGTGIEFQSSKDGTETTLPIGIEYGLSKKISILFEPVPFTKAIFHELQPAFSYYQTT